MGQNSKIEWTHHTFNPWWGCTKISEGCHNCYAATFAKRTGFGWGPQAERRFFKVDHWEEPHKWNVAAAKAGERRRVFCASMADVCEDREDLLRDRAVLMQTIESTSNLDWLLLTKRPENFNWMFGNRWYKEWPRNVWVGTSVENQKAAETRIPELIKVPAAVRFLSCEPLLAPLKLKEYLNMKFWIDPAIMPLGAAKIPQKPPQMTEYKAAIDWVICGGESGNGARPMEAEWARDLKKQCEEGGNAFFMKQMGGVRDKKGTLEDLPEDLRVRQFPTKGELCKI